MNLKLTPGPDGKPREPVGTIFIDEPPGSKSGVLVAEYRLEFYGPRVETWPAARAYPRLPLSWEAFLLVWRWRR